MAGSACRFPEMTFAYFGGALFALEMAGTVVVLQLISLFFCCGKFPGEDCIIGKPDRITATYIDQKSVVFCDQSKLIVGQYRDNLAHTRGTLYIS